MLERLLLDPDPIVLEHLLANPRVTEGDVLRPHVLYRLQRAVSD